MKCAVCGHRKGRRSCPAKGALICPQCCGEKRIVEIDCPESCAYLQSGRENERAQNLAFFAGGDDPVVLEKRRRVIEEHHRLISAIEYLIGDQRRLSRGFGDRQALEAVTLVLETLRTEDRGILYERTSADPEVEAVRRQLAGLLESLRHPSEQGMPPLRLGTAIDCLEYVRGTIEAYENEADSRRSYVDFVYRQMPRRRALEDSGPSLIVPGR